jgi:hypothetical protein
MQIVASDKFGPDPQNVMRKAVGRAGWTKQLSQHEQTIEDLKFNNYKKEMFLDSDTEIARISSARQTWSRTGS